MTEGDVGQNRRSLPISKKGMETIFINLASGANTVTLYGAYKNYAGNFLTQPYITTVPTAQDVGFGFDWFSSSGTVLNTSSSFATGALATDASTWNLDSGVTAFKIDIVIASADAQTVPVNIFMSPEYDSAGYIYIDPEIYVH
jgi:hypothetical protein